MRASRSARASRTNAPTPSRAGSGGTSAPTELEPQHLAAQRELANAARLLGDEERCLAALERATELDPTDPGLLADLAGMHVAHGDVDRGRALLTRALELETDPEWIAEWKRRLALVDEMLAPAED